MKLGRARDLKSLVIEVTSIVLGVLLALAANEWNENRTDAVRVSEALKHIRGEMLQNQKLLTFVHETNAEVVELLLQSADPQQVLTTKDETAPQLKFIPALQIQDTAWKMITTTGVAQHMEYTTLNLISSVYSLQEIYRSMGYQLIQAMTNTRSFAAVAGEYDDFEIPNELFADNMALIVQVEQALLNEYVEVMGKLDKI